MIGPAFFSSGDLLADRRYEYARLLQARGEPRAAADLLEQAVELAPEFASAWFALGDLRARLGDRAGAVAALRRARAADPQDRCGAGLLLARLGVDYDGMSEAYVETLFDQYAPRFEAALVEGLRYSGPALIRQAIEKTCEIQGRPARFSAMLDLGCGTGLAGAEFRELVQELTGVDLSHGMLAEAGAKGLYDRLEACDLLSFLRAEAGESRRYDLVIAADVLVYLENLAPVLGGVSRIFASGGLLAFTVETHPGDGVILGERLRYAHGAAHVRAALAAAGLKLLDLAEVSTRLEAGVPVPGLLALAAPD